MLFKNPVIQTMKEIEEYVTLRKKEAEIKGTTFDDVGFMEQVDHTRFTTHRDLSQSFEYIRTKF